MKTAGFAIAMALFGTAWAQDGGPAADPALLAPATPGVDPQARRSAIAAVLAEQPAPGGGPAGAPPALSARSPELERFERLVEEATVPDCLHADGLKRQPPRILFVQLGGPIALPWVVLAALRGKCQMR